jgi:hypothetical protein
LCSGASIASLRLNVIPKDPTTPRWWPLLPLPFALLFFRRACRCVRHAYLRLTPLGIEIFPFFNARQNLQVIYWSEIAAAEVNARNQLVIHFNKDRSSGVVASLSPIAPTKRALLKHAIEGRMRKASEG